MEVKKPVDFEIPVMEEALLDLTVELSCGCGCGLLVGVGGGGDYN